MKIVGVDCATVDAKVGLALGVVTDGAVDIRQACLCTRERSAAEQIAGWLRGGETALIAIDAPLGSPRPLALSLIEHSAGAAIDTEPHAMFRRATDLFIQRELKKTPLDVGADRIARTAHAALRLLGRLREAVQAPIPLAWEPSDVSTIAAIEVYPAASLVANGIRSSGYKKPQHVEERRSIVEALRQRLFIHDSAGDLAASADLVDAAVCVLAGADFVAGRAMPPPDRALAEREGWIWASRRVAITPAEQAQLAASAHENE